MKDFEMEMKSPVLLFYICLPQLVAGAVRAIRAAQVLFRTFCCRSSIINALFSSCIQLCIVGYIKKVIFITNYFARGL